MPPARSTLVLLIDRAGRGRPTPYRVTRIRDTPAISGRCWRLSHPCGRTYDVTKHAGEARCECKGWLRWGHCKHIEAVRAEGLLD